MGRQIEFYMLRDDMSEFVRYASRHGDIVITRRDADSPQVQAVTQPELEKHVMVLWNTNLVQRLARKPAMRKLAADTRGHPYYRVDLPVLEVVPSAKVRWNEAEGLLTGRLYGFSFDNKGPEYRRWYERLTRWIRTRFARSPVKELPAYVGPSAMSWFIDGGVLLPTFKPPRTDVWISIVQQQVALRSLMKDHSAR